jgi:ammonia channel protein AmtB
VDVVTLPARGWIIYRHPKLKHFICLCLAIFFFFGWVIMFKSKQSELQGTIQEIILRFIYCNITIAKEGSKIETVPVTTPTYT